MKSVQWVAVRCCCTPQKVFGFLKLDARHARPGLAAVVDQHGHRYQIELRPIDNYQHDPGMMAAMRYAPDDIRELGEREVAVYSDDRPLDFWRTIPAFVEAAATPGSRP